MKPPTLTLIHPVIENLAPLGRSALLPALHAAQAQYGYIPETVAAEISRLLKIPLAEIAGVIEFYDLFYSKPTGKNIIRICTDPSCFFAGSEALLHNICMQFHCHEGETSPDALYTVERAPCLGFCDHAPAALINGQSIAPVNSEIISEITGSGRAACILNHVGGISRLITRRCGNNHTTSLEEYQADGGYLGFVNTLQTTPAAIVAEIKASGLVGRGGAAFPTGIKWEGAAQALSTPRYVVCNADESEPGTFKDRVLLEDDPHSVLEGLLIAGYAVQASKGYIYIRGEYPGAWKAVTQAVESARQTGYIGSDILGTGWDFNIEVFKGAGAYICGEETALFESIEGKRGFPRLKPPYPTTHGLFGQPTVINNVETFCCIPHIIKDGSASFKAIGTEKSSGTKLFCLSGDVSKPGLYEVPFGTTLRSLLFDLAGGIRKGRDLQAMLIGGAAGAFATSQHLDVRLSFEGLRSAGLSLGSGVILVIDDSRSLKDILLRLTRFFAHESCGKCFPCQLGTQRQYEILQRIANDQSQPGDLDRLTDVGWTMTDASICGLGQTAASAVLSAIKLWPSLFYPDSSH